MVFWWINDIGLESGSRPRKESHSHQRSSSRDGIEIPPCSDLERNPEEMSYSPVIPRPAATYRYTRGMKKKELTLTSKKCHDHALELGVELYRGQSFPFNRSRVSSIGIS